MLRYHLAGLPASDKAMMCMGLKGGFCCGVTVFAFHFSHTLFLTDLFSKHAVCHSCKGSLLSLGREDSLGVFLKMDLKLNPLFTV